eukprot:11189152-Karenia_brevis.AAC.1
MCKKTRPSDIDPISIRAVSVHDLKGVVTQVCQLRARGIVVSGFPDAAQVGHDQGTNNKHQAPILDKE